jgi:hypothetical protein
VLARVHPSVGPPDIELHAPQLMAGAPGRFGGYMLSRVTSMVCSGARHGPVMLCCSCHLYVGTSPSELGTTGHRATRSPADGWGSGTVRSVWTGCLSARVIFMLARVHTGVGPTGHRATCSPADGWGSGTFRGLHAPLSDLWFALALGMGR